MTTTFNLTQAAVHDPMAAVNSEFDKINSFIDSYEPRSMKKVTAEFDKLSSVIDQLGSKVSGVLAKQENEFLGAYRAHMYNVQRDLQALRAEVVEKENALTNNEQMQKLEEECEWYRKESLRLDSLLEDEKKKNEDMREETKLLTSERNWMAKQLRSAKKQNMLLRAEIELQLREGTDANEQMFAQQPATTGQVRESFDLPSPSPRPASHTAVMRSMKGSKSAAQLPSDNTKLLQKELRTVKIQRDATKKQAALLRATIVEESTGRKELEEFFLDCIEDVKKGIERRRRKAAGVGKLTEVQEVLLQKPVELHDFMSQDRKKVVESLLSRDEVLSMLFDSIFPAQEGGGGNQSTVEVGDGDDLMTLLQYSKTQANNKA